MADISDLEEVHRKLGSLVEDKMARLSAVVQTGYDETCMIGTADAFLRLALAAVEFVAAAHAGTARLDLVGEVECFGSGNEFRSVCAARNVRIDGGWIAPNPAAAEKAVKWCDDNWGA